MKILHAVQLYEPHKGGSEEVVKQISERLVSRGHDVTVVTGKDDRRTNPSINGVRVVEFDVSGNTVRGITGDAAGYRRFLLEARFDVGLFYAAQIWSTDVAMEILERVPWRKVLVPCGYSGLSQSSYSEYFRDLPERLQLFDALVYMSDSYQDYRFGQDHGLGAKAVVIPNGASAEEFDSDPPSFRDRYGIHTERMVLTVANHYYAKGHTQAIEAFRAAGDRDATMVIIGEGSWNPRGSCLLRCTISGLRPRIRLFRGLSREMIVSAYKEADVFLFASEVECAPLVIYEAMASGTPFVSTDCGNVRDNSAYGIVVREPDDLAPALRQLLADAPLRAELGQKGRRRWQEAHTWDKITDQYEALYERLIAR